MCSWGSISEIELDEVSREVCGILREAGIARGRKGRLYKVLPGYLDDYLDELAAGGAYEPPPKPPAPKKEEACRAREKAAKERPEPLCAPVATRGTGIIRNKPVPPKRTWDAAADKVWPPIVRRIYWDAVDLRTIPSLAEEQLWRSTVSAEFFLDIFR